MPRGNSAGSDASPFFAWRARAGFALASALVPRPPGLSAYGFEPACQPSRRHAARCRQPIEVLTRCVTGATRDRPQQGISDCWQGLTGPEPAQRLGNGQAQWRRKSPSSSQPTACHRGQRGASRHGVWGTGRTSGYLVVPPNTSAANGRVTYLSQSLAVETEVEGFLRTRPAAATAGRARGDRRQHTRRARRVGGGGPCRDHAAKARARARLASRAQGVGASCGAQPALRTAAQVGGVGFLLRSRDRVRLARR